MVKAVIVRKGGAGSGHFGHSGRPGKVGGSSPGTGNAIIDDAVEDVLKIVPSLSDIKIREGEAPPGVKSWGHYGGKDFGIVIYTDNINKWMSEHEDSDYNRRWFGVNDWSVETMIRHTVAHELGHQWWRTNSVKTKTLQPIPKFMAGRRMRSGKALLETNPVLINWRETVFPNKYNSFTQYAKHTDSYVEAFCDSFAQFTMGEPMDSTIENWVWDNVK